MESLPVAWREALWPGLVVCLALAAAWLAHRLLFRALYRFAASTRRVAEQSFVRHSRGPALLLSPLLALSLVLPGFTVPDRLRGPIDQTLALGLIGGVAWLLVGLLDVVEDVVEARFKLDQKDSLAARKVRTQVRMFHRVGVVIIVLVTGSMMLMTFPDVRHLGLSLFASAGIAGLIVGMAARPTLSNLIAGLQVALTEPIRLDDVVIVEGEWGWIEEINTTYVVVRIWDLRRLVLPLSYFIEKPFQNWTLTGTRILGTVFLYTDYTVPADAVRGELQRILNASKLWDREVWGLQVTNTTEHVIELRALMSAVDSDAVWDLRCEVREALVKFLQERYPQALPRSRVELREPIRRAST